MALDIILIDGDTVAFDSILGLAIVDVKPGKMKASGKSKINGKKICVQGDEKKVKVTHCTYATTSFPQKGMGDLVIEALNSNQISQKSDSNGNQLLLKGKTFIAKFEVKIKAKFITPNGVVQEDFRPFYIGTGTFISSNKTIKST